MIDLTDEQLLEFYGLTFDEDGDEHTVKNWKPDFSKWVAFSRKNRWCIAPKLFWDANKCIPDHCIGFEVEGFRECSEHMLDSNIENQEQVLRDLGFQVLVGETTKLG